MRHWEPRIATAVDDGARRGSRPPRRARARAALVDDVDREVRGALRRSGRGPGRDALRPRWGSEPGFVDVLAQRFRAALDGRDAHVVFTAHSLPTRILEAGDTYLDELLETSRLVADRGELGDWSFSFQSESQTGEPWLGPDILDHLGELAERGVTDVVACPVGFVSDHLEIRWDLDVEAAERARELGLAFARIEMPNDAPDLVDVLAGIVRRELAAVTA